ncbi:MAG: hypothetical protein ACRD8Z_03200, partial [Nitrososphaeraceae archaeon]
LLCSALRGLYLPHHLRLDKQFVIKACLMSLQQEDVVNCLALMIIHRHRIAKITYDIYFSEGIQIHIQCEMIAL